MISDNFVIGDNVYLNELKNFFFEVLGMMSITHYGAVGDGRTDNYAYIQVAIDDANRRGLKYIYVPYGRFRYRGKLINRENVEFIGNPRAKIYNDRTGEEIEILQFGVNGGWQIEHLKSDLIILNGSVPILTTGSYLTDAFNLVINSNVIVPRGSTFYYDASTTTFSWLTGYAKYESGVWTIYSGPEPEPQEEEEMRKLTGDLVLSDGQSPTLTEGFYFTGVYTVFHNERLATNVLFGTGEILYYDADTKTLAGSFKSVFYEEGLWGIMENEAITNEVINSREKIPTSQAVYTAINGTSNTNPLLG